MRSTHQAVEQALGRFLQDGGRVSLLPEERVSPRRTARPHADGGLVDIGDELTAHSGTALDVVCGEHRA